MQNAIDEIRKNGGGVYGDADAGKVSVMGVQAQYALNKQGVLTIHILEKPFLVSREYVESRIKEFFK